MSDWAVWVDVSSQSPEGREARQEVSPPRPVASAGAHVGTVRATIEFFLTLIEDSSGNWTVWPRNGSSITTGDCATTRPNRRLPGRRIDRPAEGGPPRRWLKNVT